jgi:hypothetical protein
MYFIKKCRVLHILFMFGHYASVIFCKLIYVYILSCVLVTETVRIGNWIY